MNTPTASQASAAHGATFEILSFLDNPSGSDSSLGFRPHSVKRLSDSEVFTIDDVVTEGVITGKIVEFSLLNGNIFVTTTWSGVGVSLDGIRKLPTLPSQFQHGERVRLNFFGIVFPTCWIHKVHFSVNKVSYDVNAIGQHDGKTEHFRLYNVDSDFVLPRKKD